MSALLRLREIVRGARSSWHVEVWQAGRLTNSSTYPNRRAARAFASALAKEMGAVVILAGPDRILAPASGRCALAAPHESHVL